MINREELEMLLEWNEHHSEVVPPFTRQEALDEDDLPFTEPNIPAEEVPNAEED